MAHPRGSTKGLTLKQVAKVLDVSPRQIQYLREIQLVEPQEIGLGRGRFCRYSDEDIMWLYLVLVELKAVDYTVTRKIVETAKSTSKGTLDVPLGPTSRLKIDLQVLSRAVAEILGRRPERTPWAES